ncbi:hypothetical protein DL240_01560 [Lujinxingia litoralis]|uniref:Zinc finger/thioredoxin putative domain-containing protein n=1 Tax=Lujinxingia litoralis TaxID=2211119 RepID=A0A328CDU4_9DELT|nr:zinc-ribbon domain-containing protein [Lujinxingia litoralis]RAL24923.1 hypothetical protein DL240_01560 [Lujinxingia litoralis]
MIVQCPSCSSRYRVNDANIPASGGKIKCPSCAHAFVVYPEAPVEPEYEADKTSVAERPNIHELLNSMNQHKAAAQAPAAGEDEVAKTEVMSGAELPDFASMFGEGGDQTVEMSNPLGSGFLPGMGGAQPSDEDDLNTQELSPDIVQQSLQHVRAQAKAVPAAMPELDDSPATQIAPPPSMDELAPRQRLSASVEPTPAPRGAANFGATPAPVGSRGSSPSSPGMTPPAAASDIDPGHDGPWKLQTNFGLTYEFADNKSLRTWLASRDDLEGYKLSAGGEFHALSSYPQFQPEGGAGRSGNFSVGSSGGQAPIPGMAASPAPIGDGMSPPLAQPGVSPMTPAPAAPAPAPAAASPFMTAGMPAVGQNPAGAPERVKIDPNAGFRPPSRDSNALTMVLWGVFGILGLVAVALGLHLGGIVTFPVLGGESTVSPQAPAPAAPAAGAPVPAAAAAPQAPESAAQDGARQRVQVDRMLEDARVDIDSNRLSSALDRLETARLLAPERIQIYDMNAEVYEKLGQSDKVEEMRQKARELRNDGGSPPPTME